MALFFTFIRDSRVLYVWLSGTVATKLTVTMPVGGTETSTHELIGVEFNANGNAMCHPVQHINTGFVDVEL